ncbi:MAG TPA: hypothetical protein VGW33_00225 [Terriglobia bacterium]|nr:hypothetical protein [Terriglobia bacterium]
MSEREPTRRNPSAVSSTPAIGFWRRLQAWSFPRRSRLVGILTLTGMLWCALAKSQFVDQSLAELDAYKNVRSYVDRTPAELRVLIPDLKGLEPVADDAESHQALAGILGKVRENVRQFYEKFPNTTSREDITMERLRPDGKVAAVRRETFRYLAVSQASPGASVLQEYRTDMMGNLAEPTGLEQGLVVTKGFTSQALYFHPSARLDSFFRYVGKQKVAGEDTDVVAFAQRPGWTSLTLRVVAAGRSAPVLVQGLAWIDSTTYQIMRMRTDLLAPRPDLGLMGETIDTTFVEVRFPEKSGIVLWLPQNVTVTMQWKGKAKVTTIVNSPDPDDRKGGVVSTEWAHRTYRNIHHYSDYRLFGSESSIKY